MPTCDRCGTRMARHDETTRRIEYACSTCHATELVWTASHRETRGQYVPEEPQETASD